MNDREWLAMRFEENRPHLQAVASRMLGSPSEADDAVQDTWLRLSRSDASAIENLRAWLTTAVARVCLNVLESRRSRREERPGGGLSGPPAAHAETDPEHEAIVADSVGIALLVVLEALTPPERVALVLHDVFAMPFEEIAPIIGRSPVATRKLASRARRRVRLATIPGADLARQKEIVRAFLAAARGGDFGALLGMLDPEVTFQADTSAVAAGAPGTIRGAASVAAALTGRTGGLRLALVDGAVGAAWAPRGRPTGVFLFAFRGERIAGIGMVADPTRVARIDVTFPTD